MDFSIVLDSQVGAMPVKWTYDAKNYELNLKFNRNVLNYKSLKFSLVAKARSVNSDYKIQVNLSPLLLTPKECSQTFLVPPVLKQVNATVG